jgi:hypothetical protein
LIPKTNKKIALQNFLFPVAAVAVWILMQVIMFLQNGIVTGLESTKYINEAHHFLATGNYSSGNFLFYSTEILLISFAIKLKISFLFIVLFQIIMNGLSILCFYKIVNQISSSKLLTWFSTFYFLIFYYYHLYNTYLFTESLFFSFSVIFSWFLFSSKSISVKSLLFIFIGLSILYFTRPTGIFFIPATYLFLVLKFYPKKYLKILSISAVFLLAALFFIFNYSVGSGGEFDFLLPYKNEIIICGVPLISAPHQISIPVDENSIQGLFYIITHHPQLFFSLALKRFVAFFGVSRSYYSLLHNVILCTYVYLLYLFILFGIRNLFKKNKAEAWFSITNIALMTITIMLSCDEWSNRFILSILPFILFLAVISVSNTLKKSKQKIGAE